ncbi:MAG: YgaP-like transmembrane domain [Acidimicrobiales bacterium]
MSQVTPHHHIHTDSLAPRGRAQQATSRLRRPSVNITPAERVGRVVLGVGVIVVAAVLLASAGSVLAVVLEVLLVAAGLDLAVTGGLGHCPLYAKLGHVPASLRRPT